jgi:uncharacterized membrane protein
VVYLTTGDFKTAFATTGSTVILNTLLYFIHERIWSQLSWGYKNE